MAEKPPKFDPYGILEALERHRVKYVLIGGFARVLQGTEELTRGVDVVPSGSKRQPATTRPRPGGHRRSAG